MGITALKALNCSSALWYICRVLSPT